MGQRVLVGGLMERRYGAEGVGGGSYGRGDMGHKVLVGDLWERRTGTQCFGGGTYGRRYGAEGYGSGT